MKSRDWRGPASPAPSLFHAFLDFRFSMISASPARAASQISQGSHTSQVSQASKISLPSQAQPGQPSQGSQGTQPASPCHTVEALDLPNYYIYEVSEPWTSQTIVCIMILSVGPLRPLYL